MLLCKDCNYYGSSDDTRERCSGSENEPANCKGICEYTNFVFASDPIDLEIEYPCREK